MPRAGWLLTNIINPLTLGSMYDIPNYRLVNHKLPGLQYLKGAWLRSPLDLSLTFASEQAIDQLAYVLKVDPLEFRRLNIKDEPRRSKRGRPGSELGA